MYCIYMYNVELFRLIYIPFTNLYILFSSYVYINLSSTQNEAITHIFLNEEFGSKVFNIVYSVLCRYEN